MEIQETNVHVGTSLSQQHQWAMYQVSRARRSLVMSKVEQVKSQLSELLYGLNLDIGELYQYRTRLMSALTLADDLQSGELPELSRLVTPRTNKVYQVGPVLWRPNITHEPPLEFSAEHALHSRKLLQVGRAYARTNQDTERSPVHTLEIVVAQGLEGFRSGADVVEMTRGGIHAMNEPGQVVHLRLPPRFPREAEILQLGRAA
ncbi:MAG: hypothetical protein HY319_00415 [Armatimonadetes bacterium]|nr:hypothetical protein [Armatimonadota bacterium]